MRVAAILLVVAILGVTGCSESPADSDPAVAHTPAPPAETDASSSDAGRRRDRDPCTDCGPCTDRRAGDTGCDPDDQYGNA